MRRVIGWMEDHGLDLAAEKTELVIITKRYITTEIPIGHLGIRMNNKLSYWEQIIQAADIAAAVTMALSRIMANVHGPRASKRRLLMTVTQSIMLYGAEIWAGTLNKKKYCKRMAAVQQRGALRIASSYCTVSKPAILVIAGVLLIDLLAQEKS
ncbi:uncharacterized protein LOC117175416 [Belonocnema kinseyi]|uniref:uncharacterized protein LOC117175416 n=1 Tax=Belonocnema kinseyi TaxID=2817044 RepID=UPI00143D30E4|nr:uncharacterized protein LOC117175416 [Belonocnema kinseyi]